MLLLKVFDGIKLMKKNMIVYITCFLLSYCCVSNGGIFPTFPPAMFYEKQMDVGANLESLTAIAAIEKASNRHCDVDEATEQATASDDTFVVDCNLTLNEFHTITKRLEVVGDSATGISINCNGAKIDGGPDSYHENAFLMIHIRALQIDGAWHTPKYVSINGCHLKGALRITGLGNTGESNLVVDSSRADINHPLRARSIAPKHILLENNIFQGHRTTPVYLSPGTTHVTIKNNKFVGTAASVALYLDTESGYNHIVDNEFDMELRRENIAVDSSENNIIESNEFIRMNNGGVFLYRNCGEGDHGLKNGGIRFTPPAYNTISKNTFKYAFRDVLSKAVVIGSRNGSGGRSDYCEWDSGYPYSAEDLDIAFSHWGSDWESSSTNNYDFARNNKVVNNVHNCVEEPYQIKNEQLNHSNIIEHNRKRLLPGSPLEQCPAN